MIYVIDTSSWQQMFGCYRRARFPTLWQLFDELVASGAIISVSHVLREIENRDKQNDELEWAKAHTSLFPDVNEQEIQFLRKIFQVPRFRHVIPDYLRDTDDDENTFEFSDAEKHEEEKTDESADPFLIARAKILDGMVITQERERGNRVRIPTICGHFDIECGTLDDLMEKENWSF